MRASSSNLLIILLLCAICASPVICISRWFSATFNDLKFTLYRYGHCVNGLQPLTSTRFNETEYLINQIRTFLDQANYDNEQLSNVTKLMDKICQPIDPKADPNVTEAAYPVSINIDLDKFTNPNPGAKENRCRAIEDSLDAMYPVLKRAALNSSEPLDFSVIQFYANESDKSTAYSLVDLINTSWIQSEVNIEHTCAITNATKEYVASRGRNATVQARRDQVPAGYVSSLLELLDRMLEPVLGVQKRLYWEGTTRLELIQTRLSSGLGAIRGGIGNGLGKTRQMIFGARNSSAAVSAADGNNTSKAIVIGENSSLASGGGFAPSSKSKVNGTNLSLSGKAAAAVNSTEGAFAVNSLNLTSLSSTTLTTAVPNMRLTNYTLEK